MRKDDFIGQPFYWFTGIIEDVTDPDMLNRVRVRCIGYHSQDTGKVTTEDLPWATVVMPNTDASLKGVGSNHELEIGSWVVGFFRDGMSAQDPMVLGSIATQTEGEKDIPVEAQLSPPTNKVHKTQAGHLIEFDNTEGATRINIQHKSGTTININEAGDVFIDSISDVISIDGNTTITGSLTVSEDTTLQKKLAVTDTITGSSTVAGTNLDTGHKKGTAYPHG